MFCEFPQSIFNLEAATKEETTDFLLTLATHLEFALYLVINHKAGMKSPRALHKEYLERKEQFVHNIEIVYRYPIYGYHKDKKPFIRIELYDYRNIKKAQCVVQKGVLFGGVAMQVYEAHLSYFMHFYGDYCLSGMDFVKITEFMIRHLTTFEDSKAVLRQKAVFPHARFSPESDERIDVASVETEYKGKDYGFLQKDNYLKVWHADMPELGEDTEEFISPYPRVSSCEIELDCSCKDILNIWENDRGIVGGTI